MAEKEVIQIEAVELSKKRNSKSFFRVRPSECPIKEKYCYKSFRDTKKDNLNIEEFVCPFLVKRGMGNEDGEAIIVCSCTGNSLKFIMEKEDD